jgi:cupin superfamily acireductone dioxygenase involved in methionine salvage
MGNYIFKQKKYIGTLYIHNDNFISCKIVIQNMSQPKVSELLAIFQKIKHRHPEIGNMHCDTIDGKSCFVLHSKEEYINKFRKDTCHLLEWVEIHMIYVGIQSGKN